MSLQSLTDTISSLKPNEQESVRQFGAFLRGKERSSAVHFLAAVDEFIDQDPELLRRLAQ